VAPGLILAFSARHGQSAFDGTAHSPFADALLKQLEAPGQQLDVLFSKVANDVRNATKDRQTPEIFGLEYGRGLSFQQAEVSTSK